MVLSFQGNSGSLILLRNSDFNIDMQQSFVHVRRSYLYTAVTNDMFTVLYTFWIHIAYIAIKGSV